jgi:polyisoprenoid-binding protein YceI
LRACSVGEITRSGDELTIADEATIKGHTGPIEIRGHVTDPIADPFRNERFRVKLETQVDRTHFGVTSNNPLPGGEPALSNSVAIIADLQLVREAQA